MESTWTISELAATAAAALSGEPVQVNGRIRDLPNERMIRWYTTIGLVDPPLTRRGRTALYGRRHLLQLIAIKRRQAAGQTIAQIQVELTGATDRTLEHIARLPGRTPAETPPAAPAETPPGTPIETPALRPRFWAGPARGLAAADGHATTRPSFPEEDPAVERTSDDDLSRDGVVVHGVRLAPGALLLLDRNAPTAPTADDLAALRVAARPLLEALRSRGLLPAPPPSTQFPTGRST